LLKSTAFGKEMGRGIETKTILYAERVGEGDIYEIKKEW